MALVYFKALSDETRLRLVHILLHYELSVNELVRILGMGQSRVSRHLKILTEAGLLTSRRDGLWVFYAATRCGEASDFLQAMGPFLHTDTAMREDLAMAAQILEERALKTRQFFNAIAEDWDELNREVLEDFDLPAAVLAAALASHSPKVRLTLCDVSAPAVEASRATLAANSLAGDVFASNVFSEVNGRFDMIISNPPFHDGLQTSLEAAQALIRGAVRHLNSGGELRIVANAFLPYPQVLDETFGFHEVIAQTGRFKVYRTIMTRQAKK